MNWSSVQLAGLLAQAANIGKSNVPKIGRHLDWGCVAFGCAFGRFLE